MATQTYKVNGMHCENCARSITKALSDTNGIESIHVDHATNTAHITAASMPAVDALNETLKNNKLEYTLELSNPGATTSLLDAIYSKCKPYLLQSSILITLALIAFVPYFSSGRTLIQSMNIFMGGFFIVFASFKFYNLQAFAMSFAQYDELAKRSKNYALAYPFIQMTLGLLYLFDIAPFITNLVTLVLMTFAAYGVWKALHTKRKIQCACLGTKFNIPLSYLTLFEDIIMAIMALYMLLPM